jgi:hypothetical protein
MESYDFGLDLIQRHNLVPVLTQGRAISGSPAAPGPWRLHLNLNSRFSSEYDYRTGNLTLYFIDPDRGTAQRILAYYLERLRDRLRNEAVREASAAAGSLAEEVGKTPDAPLQNQLYELMARQIQREKLAQVKADFAFKIVEPPAEVNICGEDRPVPSGSLGNGTASSAATINGLEASNGHEASS